MSTFFQRIGILEQSEAPTPPGVTIITYAIPGLFGDFNDPEDAHKYAVPGAFGDVNEAA